MCLGQSGTVMYVSWSARTVMINDREEIVKMHNNSNSRNFQKLTNLA